MDQELIAYLDARFSETSREFREVKETVGQVQIMVESMRDDIRQVAEGGSANDQKLDAFKGEVAAQLEDMRALLRPAYGDLNRRVSALESWRERTERDPLEIIRERPRGWSAGSSSASATASRRGGCWPSWTPASGRGASFLLTFRKI